MPSTITTNPITELKLMVSLSSSDDKIDRKQEHSGKKRADPQQLDVVQFLQQEFCDGCNR